MAYDVLKETRPSRAAKEYLEILYLAAHESETGVDDALRAVFDAEAEISTDVVKMILASKMPVLEATRSRFTKFCFKAMTSSWACG
jgi:hypothetical protein